jgi:hypothetical protein
MLLAIAEHGHADVRQFARQVLDEMDGPRAWLDVAKRERAKPGHGMTNAQRQALYRAERAKKRNAQVTDRNARVTDGVTDAAASVTPAGSRAPALSSAESLVLSAESGTLSSHAEPRESDAAVTDADVTVTQARNVTASVTPQLTLVPDEPKAKRKRYEYPETLAANPMGDQTEWEAWCRQWGFAYTDPAVRAMARHHLAKGNYWRDWRLVLGTWVERERTGGGPPRKTTWVQPPAADPRDRYQVGEGQKADYIDGPPEE